MTTNLHRLLAELRRRTKKYKDVSFYDQEQWRTRESVEHNAHLTMCAEGLLHELLNGYRKPDRHDLTLTKLNEIAFKYDYIVEQYFSWSWHFYPSILKQSLHTMVCGEDDNLEMNDGH